MRSRIRRAAAAAGFAGLIVGIGVTVAFLGEPAAAQSRNQRKVINPPKGPQTGLPFSPGILVGNTLYVSGHLGQDPAASAPRRVVPGGIEAETRRVLGDIRDVLKTAGMDFSDVVSVNAYLIDLNDFDKFNAVYRESFPKDPPARTTVQVAKLNIGGRVEVQMVAVKP